jgi:hypothetical protein
MKSLLIASSLLLAVSLTACHQQQPQVVEVQPQQQQPQVIVQQQPQVVAQPVYVPQQPVIVQQDNSANNLATGMLLGAAMSGGNSRTVVVHHYSPSITPAPVIVNKTVINRTVVAAPAYRAPMATASRGNYSSYSSTRTTTTVRR